MQVGYGANGAVLAGWVAPRAGSITALSAACGEASMMPTLDQPVSACGVTSDQCLPAGAGSQRGVKALQIGGEHRVMQRAGGWLERAHDVGAVGHLRHALGRDKAAGFDMRQASSGQALDQLQLDVGRHRRGFVLQAVARADFHQGDMRGIAHVGRPVVNHGGQGSTKSSRSLPSLTCSPTAK